MPESKKKSKNYYLKSKNAKNIQNTDHQTKKNRYFPLGKVREAFLINNSTLSVAEVNIKNKNIKIHQSKAVNGKYNSQNYKSVYIYEANNKKNLSVRLYYINLI